jgi:hypothetical protein
VWLWRDIPYDLRQTLGLTNQDMGIDLIVKKHGRWCAIQCKWRKPQTRRRVPGHPRIETNKVPWADLATFYSLCERSGPINGWYQKIVMTSAEGVKRIGGIRPGDVSICLGRWRALDGTDWFKMLEVEGRRVTDSPLTSVPPANLDQLRALRLARFG